MSRYPASMEIEQCEPESTFLDDVSKLITFVRTHDNSFAEYVRVARMYLFGTPIRRKGTGIRHATPGCIRLKLYSSKQNTESSEAVIDDEVDFPLRPNGDLDFHRVKLWWGVKLCAALEPYNWKVFRQHDPDTISGIAVHNLSAGQQNRIDLLFVPTETDEYRREEQGTWTHELKWQHRALADDPAWYFNRLVALCALWWLLFLVPGAFTAVESAASALVLTLVLVARWVQQVMRHLELHSISALARRGSFWVPT